MIGALRVYEDDLRARGCRARVPQARFRDGTTLPLGLERWLGPADATDQELLDRVRGPVLDVGCGPGRHLHALAARGYSRSESTSRRWRWSWPSDGADARSSATSSTSYRAAGPGEARCCWTATSASAARRRVSWHGSRALLDEAGEILAEVEPPSGITCCTSARLESGERGQRVVSLGPRGRRRDRSHRRAAGFASRGLAVRALVRAAARDERSARGADGGPPARPGTVKPCPFSRRAGSPRQSVRGRAQRRVLAGVELSRRGGRGGGRARALGQRQVDAAASPGRAGPARRGRDRAGRREPDRAAGARALARTRLRHVGFVFQSFHLIEELSGAENVLLPTRLPGAAARRGRRARELIERAGAGRGRRSPAARAVRRRAAALRDRPRAGQRSRAGAGRRADRQPRRRQRRRPCSALLRGLSRRAVVIVTHEPEAAGIADRVLRLEGGSSADAAERPRPTADRSASGREAPSRPRCARLASACGGGAARC